MRLRLLAVGLLSGVFAASSAYADAPQQIAEAHMKTGLKQFSDGQFEAARLSFLQAQSVYPRPSLLRNLALCELKTNRPLEALRHLRVYLDDPGLAAEKKDQAAKNYEEAWSKTGHASVKVAEGASIFLDGVQQAPVKDVVDATPGVHRLEARLGARFAALDVELPAGVSTDVDLSFRTPAVVAAAPPVEEKHGAEGGVTPPPREETTTTSWGTGQKVALAMWIGGGAALASGIGFAFAKGQSTKAIDNLESFQRANGISCPASASKSCSELSDRQSERDRNGALSVGLIVGGSVVAVAGTAVFFLAPRARGAATHVSPLIGPRFGGLSWTSTF